MFRGGACIFARALFAAASVTNRRVWVADSFAGIPASRHRNDTHTLGSDGQVEECDDWADKFAVSEDQVRSNFAQHGLLDSQVRFLPGFFNVSLPPVFGPSAAAAPALSVVRIDADAYDGVRDALESLYPRLSVGGWVIIDDFHLVGACQAVHEYRNAHHIEDPILIAPTDYVYTCSLGVGADVVGDVPPSPVRAGAMRAPAFFPLLPQQAYGLDDLAAGRILAERQSDRVMIPLQIPLQSTTDSPEYSPRGGRTLSWVVCR